MHTELRVVESRNSRDQAAACSSLRDFWHLWSTHYYTTAVHSTGLLAVRILILASFIYKKGNALILWLHQRYEFLKVHRIASMKA